MAPIEAASFGEAEITVPDSNDPVARQVSWAPLKRGGASFKTHRLQFSEYLLTVERTGGFVVFALIFVVPGMIALLFGAPYLLLVQKQYLPAIFMIVWGAIFGGVGLLLLKGGKRLTFDRSTGSWYRGKQPDPMSMSAPDREKHGRFEDIHALQLLRETVRSSSSNGGSSTYDSYELNLVFRDGERLNVMDHGNRESLEESARQLGAFLNVPVWKEA